MSPHHELVNSLKRNFKINKSRLNCLAGMLLALICVCSVNLRKIALAFASDTLLDSRYKRLKRFFAWDKFDLESVFRWIYSLYVSNNQPIYLTLDRTNWYRGKSKINLLVLGIAHEGMAIPVCWQALDKAGNASAKEHIAILKKFMDLFNDANVVGVLADREFASQELFAWCNEQDKPLPFYIRVKDNGLVRLAKSKGKKVTVKSLFNHLKPNERCVCEQKMQLYGQDVYLAGARSPRGELMVVATNQACQQAIAIYLRRWEIETLFSCLKQRGFNFEQTRLTKRDRVEKLMALLAMACAWMHKIGEWRAEKKPIRFKCYANGLQRPQYSYFRYGLDFIRDLLFKAGRKMQKFRECLKLLVPIPPSQFSQEVG